MARSRNWEQMGQATYLRATLRRQHDDIDLARRACSWTALARLHSEAAKTRQKLDDLGTQVAADIASMTAEEAEEHLVEFYGVLSDPHIDLAMEEWCRRNGARIVADEGRVIVLTG